MYSVESQEEPEGLFNTKFSDFIFYFCSKS